MMAKQMSNGDCRNTTTRKGKATTFGSPTSFAINKTVKQKAAQKFLDFASGKEGAKLLAEVGVVPSYKTDEIDKIYFARKGMPSDEVSQKPLTQIQLI